MKIMTLEEFLKQRDFKGFVTENEQFELYKYGVHALIEMDVNLQSQICQLYTLYIDLMNIPLPIKNK